MVRAFLILLPIGLLAISSCCKKKLYCDADSLQVMIAGYNRLDVRNIIIKKYNPGDFKKAIDSTTFIYTGNTPVVLNKKDTLKFSDYTTTSSTIKGISQGFDWAIYLPGTPTRENYRITRLVDAEHRFEMVKCGDDETTCLNPVGHFVVNDSWKQGNTLWLELKK